jgi:hypothetical protein
VQLLQEYSRLILLSSIFIAKTKSEKSHLQKVFFDWAVLLWAASHDWTHSRRSSQAAYGGGGGACGLREEWYGSVGGLKCLNPKAMQLQGKKNTHTYKSPNTTPKSCII